MSSLRGLIDAEDRQKPGLRSVASGCDSSKQHRTNSEETCREFKKLHHLETEGDSACPFLKRLESRNATGAWLNCGVRSVAGARKATCMSFKIRILADDRSCGH